MLHHDDGARNSVKNKEPRRRVAETSMLILQVLFSTASKPKQQKTIRTDAGVMHDQPFKRPCIAESGVREHVKEPLGGRACSTLQIQALA
jgi:hypothetical protein